MYNLRFAALMLACVALFGADKQPAKKSGKDTAKASPVTSPPELIWPLPPDPPRIRWLAEYSDLLKIRNPVVRKSKWVDKVTGTKTQEERLDLVKPYGITTDRRGRIYAADTELKTIFVIDVQGKTVERRDGGSRAPMVMPVGVATDAEDRLFVSDAALHSLYCFSASGQLISSFGTAALGRPGGIALDPARNRLYVADAKESRIAVFDTGSLKLIGYFGRPAKPGAIDPSAFNAPTNVALDRKGYLYIADTWNYRVVVFNPEGRFVRAFGAQGDRPGEFIRPKGIAVDSEGHVYVADAEFNNFQVLEADGTPLLAVGSLGVDPGQFALVAGLHIDAKDRIYTTEMFHGRIQVFQYLSQAPSAPDKEVRTASAGGTTNGGQ
jgi:DNA-binding beta-propeller fold protein YncE